MPEILPSPATASTFAVKEMSDRDHYCSLMFDEMSIRENLHINQRFDCIEGFEDADYDNACGN
jgi:hypothetical protein